MFDSEKLKDLRACDCGRLSHIKVFLSSGCIRSKGVVYLCFSCYRKEYE